MMGGCFTCFSSLVKRNNKVAPASVTAIEQGNDSYHKTLKTVYIRRAFEVQQPEHHDHSKSNGNYDNSIYSEKVSKTIDASTEQHITPSAPIAAPQWLSITQEHAQYKTVRKHLSRLLESTANSVLNDLCVLQMASIMDYNPISSIQMELMMIRTVHLPLDYINVVLLS